jgi:hypothetical protein
MDSFCVMRTFATTQRMFWEFSLNQFWFAGKTLVVHCVITLLGNLITVTL